MVRPNGNAALQVLFQDYEVTITGLVGKGPCRHGCRAALVQADGTVALSFTVVGHGACLDLVGVPTAGSPDTNHHAAFGVTP
ncbi:MAG: hypothetical protein R2880_11115 [Deinococcales bacterium]